MVFRLRNSLFKSKSECLEDKKIKNAITHLVGLLPLDHDKIQANISISDNKHEILGNGIDECWKTCAIC